MEAHWTSAAAPESIHLLQPHREQEQSLSCIEISMCVHIHTYMCVCTYMAPLSSAFFSTSLNLSPGCASACIGLASPGINYMCFPVAAPRAEVIILHKRTLALACISVREPGCPQVGLGSVSGMREPLELFFFFSPPTPPHPTLILRRLIFLPAASQSR